jgi:hypothetical protein
VRRRTTRGVRRRHLGGLAGLFVQVLKVCQKAGLVSLGHVALAGTKKIRANASKHKAMSHERMLQSERQLEGEMRALPRKAKLIDVQEDGQYGKGKRGDELPEELCRSNAHEHRLILYCTALQFFTCRAKLAIVVKLEFQTKPHRNLGKFEYEYIKHI